MQRDLVHFTSSKLQGGWSASDFTKHLTKEALLALLPKFDKFEPLVRVRILLSLLTLDKELKRSLSNELQSLMAAAREDKEEWVSITAKALGNLDLPLDFDGMISGSAVVRQTVTDIEARLADSDDTAFRPLEESYLSTSIVEEARGGPEPPITHQHFVPREGASTNLLDLYKKARASAASAVASNPTISNASSPLHVLHPPSEGEAGRDPGSHAAAASDSTAARQAGMEDMFRSNRQQAEIAASRNAASASGLHERRGVSRPAQVKLLDVTEVQKLNELEARKKQHPTSSPEASNLQTQTQAGPSMETEEGEIEAGELCDDSYSEPSIKRIRVAHEALV